MFFFLNNINFDKLKKVFFFNLNDLMNCICFLFFVICGFIGFFEKSFFFISGFLCIIYIIDMNYFLFINVKVEYNLNIFGRLLCEGF